MSFLANLEPRPADSKSRGRSWRSLLTALAVLACIGGASAYLAPEVRQFVNERHSLEPLAFALAIVSYALFLWASSLQMRACLEALGASTRYPFPIFTLATLGKYLPTKAMVPVLRARLAAPEGATTPIVIAALGLEFVLGSAVGTWLGFVLAAGPVLHLSFIVTAAAAACGLGVVAFARRPIVLQAVRRAVTLVLERLPAGGRALPALEPSHAIRAVAWAAASWLAGSASLVLTFRALGSGVGQELGIAGSFALASMAGYLAFVVPAGLGVREAGLLWLLGGLLGAPAVATAVLAHRLLATGTEIVLGSMAAAWFARQRRRAVAAARG